MGVMNVFKVFLIQLIGQCEIDFIYVFFLLRPQPVDPLHGGATGVFWKAPIEKQKYEETIFLYFGLPTLFFNRPTPIFRDKKNYGWQNFIFIFNFQPTDWIAVARHQSVMQGINQLWPYYIQI